MDAHRGASVTLDVVCVGDPFLDLIFLGLPAMPVPGEERLAERLKIVPGGMANVAYALRQLGLEAVICAPRGRDAAGQFLERLLADAGVPWLGRESDVTPVSVAIPVDGDRALVSVMPPPTVDSATLGQLSMRAVVVDLPSEPMLPRGLRVYAVVGDPEVDALEGRLPRTLADVHALILNEREARRLTDQSDAAAAAAHLASLGTTVVVTRGAAGALLALPGGQTVTAPAPPSVVVDATGAGDMFIAGYIWADLAGHKVEERLRLAVSYASYSLGRAAERLKGIALDEFRGLLDP